MKQPGCSFMSYRAYVWCIGLSGVFLNPSREKLTPFAKRGEGTRKLLSPTWFPLLFFVFCIYSTAPPEHSLSRCSETAGRVKKGLGFGMWIRSGYKKPQSTSAHCRSLRCSAVASLFEPCSRLEPLRVSRLPSAPSPSARRVRLFCLTPSLHIQTVG